MEETNQSVTNEDLLEALNKLCQSSDTTNKSVQELQEYFITKDKKEKQEAETLKKQAEQDAEEQAELEEQQERDEESVRAEESAQADAQTQTYTELLTEIDDGIQLQNQLMVAQSIYIGIVVGLLFMKILFDRMFK
jgi:uncharacterized membrane protein YdbT with pleckstrin-like domain